MAARQDIPGTDTVGGYGARYLYFDPVIWIMLTRSCELRSELRRFANFSQDLVTAARKSEEILSQQTCIDTNTCIYGLSV